MNLMIKQRGSFGGSKAESVELIVTSGTTIITETITNNNGVIPEELIDDIKDVLYEIEQHNGKSD